MNPDFFAFAYELMSDAVASLDMSFATNSALELICLLMHVNMVHNIRFFNENAATTLKLTQKFGSGPLALSVELLQPVELSIVNGTIDGFTLVIGCLIVEKLFIQVLNVFFLVNFFRALRVLGHILQVAKVTSQFLDVG